MKFDLEASARDCNEMNANDLGALTSLANASINTTACRFFGKLAFDDC